MDMKMFIVLYMDLGNLILNQKTSFPPNNIGNFTLTIRNVAKPIRRSLKGFVLNMTSYIMKLEVMPTQSNVD